MENENIVQVEFFHINPSGKNFDQFTREIDERIGENLIESFRGGSELRSGLKTVVRFVDFKGEVTKAVIEAQRVHNIIEILTKKFPKKGWFIQKVATFELRYVRRAFARRRKECNVKTLKALRESIKNSDAVAVEKFDHHFRIAQKNELLELYEAASASAYNWLFVFKPADLLADRNKIVAQMMHN